MRIYEADCDLTIKCVARVRVMSKRVVITGGAGFIGSSAALKLAARHPDWQIVACDNLYRRGSELNLPRLKAAGVSFVHSDIRHRSDLERLGDFDAMVECSAEPSVMAAVDGGADFVFQTNLVGAHNCLELAASRKAQVIFLSTSRVYPLRGLEQLSFSEGETRFLLAEEQPIAGASSQGISEQFPLLGARTLYGTTKLAGELLSAEVAETHQIPVTVNRCGVIAGPWQMGKVDQGVFTHWMLSFMFDKALKYIGFGGNGKQVRDLLHVADLVDLLDLQLQDPAGWAGQTFNVGGGLNSSLSLLETSELCHQITGKSIKIDSDPQTRAGDVPVYLSDCSALFTHTDWRPKRSAQQILADICQWVSSNEQLVRSAL